MTDRHTDAVVVEVASHRRGPYLEELDAVLHELEHLTARATDQRIACNGEISGREFTALVEDADRWAEELKALSNALVDAKGRLIGLDLSAPAHATEEM